MFPAEFNYFRAGSVEEAMGLLAEHEGAKLLAGGHSLIPMMKLRFVQPSAVIDIGRIEGLAGIQAAGDRVRIGALTTHRQLETSAELAEHCPLISEAAAKIADPAVRNKGTLGGNIAHADPASDLPAALLAAGATIHLIGAGGERSVAAADFFVGLLETDLRDGEVLTAVTLPCLGAGSGTAYLKHEHPASGYAICGAAALVETEGVSCKGASLCFNGVTEVPHAAAAVAGALVDSSLSDAEIDQAVDEHLKIGEPMGDIHASGEYRAELARVFGKRALKMARDRARA